MNIDIRKYIKENFKNSNIEEIKSSIVSSISENDEITLPGMGVFFEILWNNSSSENQEYIFNSNKYCVLYYFH